jgi:hypothetical protein
VVNDVPRGQAAAEEGEQQQEDAPAFSELHDMGYEAVRAAGEMLLKRFVAATVGCMRRKWKFLMRW